MAHSQPWKVKYENFIDSKYNPSTNPDVVKQKFQQIADECRSSIPCEGEPKDAFMFAVHMTQLHRDLQNAADNYMRASDAWYGMPKTAQNEMEDIPLMNRGGMK